MKTCIPSAVLLWSFVLCLFSPAAAQVALDGTVGPSGEMSIPLRNDTYTVLESYGERVGGNLFHSLKTLNIQVDEAADFAAASDIDNIVARITGGSSRIDGTLTSTLTRSGLISNANLFLLNPSGIVFGSNARLDLGGSFHVSTADYLQMGETDRFYAQPSESDVLSAAEPQAFGFLTDSPAGIALEGGPVDPSISKEESGLRVKEGEAISIVGGDIDIRGLHGGQYDADYMRFPRLSAPAGRIRVVAAASPGEFPIADGLTPRRQMGNVRLSEGAKLTASGNGSGDIYIQGGAFLLDNGSITADNDGPKNGGGIDIKANTITLNNGDIYSDNQLAFEPGSDEAAGTGGSIRLEANDSVDIRNNSHVFADTYFVSDAPYPADDDAQAAYHQEGRAGSIGISAERVAISSGGFVSSDTYGSGNGGEIHIEGSTSVTLSGDGRIFSGTVGGAANDGDGGNIRIETRRFTMSDTSKINADTYDGGGLGGDVFVSGLGEAHADLIHVADSQIFAGAVDGQGPTAGAGGRVTLKALGIRFTDGASIKSESLGAGRGGDVTLDAAGGTILFSGANSNGEFSRVQTTAKSELTDAGNAGNIVVRGNEVIFENGGGIAASTSGPGNAGAIEVSAASELRIAGGGAIASSSDSVETGGNAGRIGIEAGSVYLTGDGSTISTETQSLVSVIGGQSYGNAGNIQLTTSSLSVAEGASITSASRNTDKGGNAGQINIEAGSMNLADDGSTISTETQSLASVIDEQAYGNAGNIRLTTGRLDVAREASISSASRNTGAAGDAGTITISADGDIAMTDGGEATTEAVNAGGGRMYITSGNMLYLEDSRITTSVQQGAENGGDIDAVARFIVLKNGQIIAKAFEGRGGNIRITADQFITTPDSVVSASSELGIDGDIFIESPVTDISSFLAVLPDQFLDAGQWIVKSCAERAVEDASRFIVKEREGAPTPVDDWLASPF